MGEVGLVADGRHDDDLGLWKRRLEALEIAMRDDPVLVPLKQEDFRGDSRAMGRRSSRVNRSMRWAIARIGVSPFCST